MLFTCLLLHAVLRQGVEVGQLFSSSSSAHLQPPATSGSHTLCHDTSTLTAPKPTEIIQIHQPILSLLTPPHQLLPMETTTKVLALFLCLMTDLHASPEWPLGGTLGSPQGTVSYKTITLSAASLQICIWPHHLSPRVIWLKRG